MAEGSMKISIREATIEDRSLMAEWHEDKLLQTLYPLQAKLNMEKHNLWFNRIHKTEDIVLLIGLIDIIRIGTVLYDRRSDGQWQVHVYLKPAYLRQNLIGSFLDQAYKYLCEKVGDSQAVLETKFINDKTITLLQDSSIAVVLKTENTVTARWGEMMRTLS